MMLEERRSTEAPKPGDVQRREPAATPEPSAAGSPQDAYYTEGYDYRNVSPHLSQPVVFEGLLRRIRHALAGLDQRGVARTVLDIGGGDGAFAQPLLAYGCDVTTTEMSRSAAERLMQLYGQNRHFQVRFDRDGTLGPVAGTRFGLVLYSSVLHHIPDYLVAIERCVDTCLEPGGTLISIQDPLWYPRMKRGVHAFSEMAFACWRLQQGNVARGVRSRWRRYRSGYDESNPADNVEYHAVRNGVDEEAIRDVLSSRFASVEVVKYWSTWLRSLQAFGDRLTLANTFAIVAEDFEGQSSRAV